jgi:hypothetical protein
LSLSEVALGDGVPAGEGQRASYTPELASDAQVRLGLNIDTRKLFFPFNFSLHYEQDLATGVYQGGGDNEDGVGLPFDRPSEIVNGDELTRGLRNAYVNLSFAPALTLRAGYMTSHWGMGLLANDGAHGWTPGSAYFGDPRGGDRVLRYMAITGPFNVLGRPLIISAAMDEVQSDDIMLEGDSAQQKIAAVVWGFQQERQVGAYVVRRHQETPQPTTEAKRTDVWVADLYTKWSWKLTQTLTLKAEAEGVLIKGETTLAPSVEHPTSEVLQLALATRIKLDTPRWGGVLDLIAASGDQNFDDGRQSGFKADPNFEVGLMLFKGALAAQTARAPVSASDLTLVGQPNEDLERFPTRGSVSNTYTAFPRLWYRLAPHVELYGGPLLAWGEVPLADPRNSRFAGGYPANLLGGEARDRFLGVEADLGIRAQLFVGGVELMIGAEGGALFSGPAFEGPNGDLGTIYGGRFITQVKL